MISTEIILHRFNSIFDQTKEISILRAIGISKFAMYRIYIYEAVVIVLGSSLFGVIIGSAVGYSMILQQTLFTELPLPLVFPWQILELISLLSLILAVFASYAPTRFLLRMPIVALMRFVQ